MFRLSEKLKYMVLGGFLISAGFMFGNMNSDTEAQFGSEKTDKLTVQELTVLEDITVIADDGEPRVVISWNERGGQVTCLGSGEERDSAQASLLVGMFGGIAGVTSGQGIAGASLTIGTEGGGVTIFPVPGKEGGASLAIVDGDGVVFRRDKFGELRSLEQ